LTFNSQTAEDGLAEHLSKHEEEYSQEFMRMLEELKKYV